ncbi:MAG: hypothetical protein M3340_07630 [Actinomycetota bacterium]|nr:hypothetical protein [Actinomycetota bacterium]
MTEERPPEESSRFEEVELGPPVEAPDEPGAGAPDDFDPDERETAMLPKPRRPGPPRKEPHEGAPPVRRPLPPPTEPEDPLPE